MYCEAECGWSRPFKKCVTGLSTEQSEIEQRLGDCSDADDGDTTYIAVGIIVAVVVVSAATAIVVCNKRSGATAEVQARAARHMDNPAYNRNNGNEPEVYEDMQARGMVSSLDGRAYADVAPVVGGTSTDGYEQPASTYA